MEVSIPVKFANQSPDLETIFYNLKRSTGLSGIIIKGRRISHYLFYNRSLSLFFEGNIINVDTHYLDRWYLLDAVIAVLVNMGGQLENYMLPQRAFKVWEPTDEFEDILFYENSLRIITFVGAIPNAETILNHYRTHTGLFDIRLEKNIEHPHLELLDVKHEFVPPNSISFNFIELPPPDRSQIAIGISPDNKVKSWYFLEALFATLVGLGGNNSESIPKKAWVTWEKAEKLYENDPRFLKM